MGEVGRPAASRRHASRAAQDGARDAPRAALALNRMIERNRSGCTSRPSGWPDRRRHSAVGVTDEREITSPGIRIRPPGDFAVSPGGVRTEDAIRRDPDPVAGQRRQTSKRLDVGAVGPHRERRGAHTREAVLRSSRCDGGRSASRGGISERAEGGQQRKAWAEQAPSLERGAGGSARPDGGVKAVGTQIGEPTKLITDAIVGIAGAAHVAEVDVGDRGGEPAMFYRTSDFGG